MYGTDRKTYDQYSVETLAGHKFSPIMYITKMVVDRSDVQSKKGKVQLEMSVLAKISHVSGVG